MALIKGKGRQTSAVEIVSEGADAFLRMLRDGTISAANWLTLNALEGRMFVANGGVGTTPITFAGAYDADAPDLYIYVPSGTTIIPVYIGVKYEAVGTETELEAIALASRTGDSTATGTALTIKALRTDAPLASKCTATAAVGAAGIDDPNAAGANFYEFWRRGHPLKDTSASGENDRHEQVYEWKLAETLVPPGIVGPGALAIYAASQAGTGFIEAIWLELASGNIT